jgi:hypothetical protein
MAYGDFSDRQEEKAIGTANKSALSPVTEKWARQPARINSSTEQTRYTPIPPSESSPNFDKHSTGKLRVSSSMEICPGKIRSCLANRIFGARLEALGILRL